MALFASAIGDGRLVMSAHADIVGAPYVFELHFEAAMPAENYYALRVETSWGGQPATHQHYYRTTSESWFRFWTRNFRPAKPPRPDAGQGERYRALCTAALEAERHLDSIPAIQSAIVAAMKRGARFTTSHKEGGTNLTWNGERFLRVDDGEYPAVEAFSGEAEFLAALRQFYDWEVSRNVYPDKAGELVAWKLILRLLRTA